MRKRTKGQDVSVTDLFCGAGGSSIGAEAAGARLVMAANHWRLAIDTHNSNFPNAAHDCADISQVDPRRYPRTDILIASPECTTHSPAGGKRPTRTMFDDSPAGIEEIERSRVTMWDVVRFTEHHRYDAIVVENVIEIRRWLPFESWLMAMRALGYQHQAVYMNSMVAHPTPQSRDRIYVVFWRDGNRAPDLRFDIPAWCARHGVVDAIQSWKRPDAPYGKYRTQYLYRCPSCAEIALPFAYPASTAIDWSLPAPRIGDRDRALAPATMRRIKAGLEKYGPAAIIAGAGNTWERPNGLRAWPINAPLPTQATTAQHALVVDTGGYKGDEKVRPVAIPFNTQTARQQQALVVPLRTNGTAFPADAEPLRSCVAGNQGQALVIPMRQHTAVTEAHSAPLPTMNASQTGAALLVPAGGTWNDEALPTTEPMRTRTGRENEAIVFPPMLMRAYRGGSEMVTPVTEPARTVTAIDHHSLLVPYFGTGVAHPTSEPIGAVTAIDRRALLTPMAVDVEDCGFRMLEPHEIGAAMAFPETYKVLGNKRERVRQYGNAVTPPVMDLILRRVIASLGGGR